MIHIDRGDPMIRLDGRGFVIRLRHKGVVPRGGRARLVLLALAVSFAALVPRPAAAQAADLLQTLRNGGSWVEIPIAGGSGVLETDAVPTLGLTLNGCVNVWPGHTGEWTIEARDPLNGGRMDATLVPGVGRLFSYRTGLRSRLDVRVRWSEPRDTTLLVWVGLEGTRTNPPREDPCQPVYGSEARDERRR